MNISSLFKKFALVVLFSFSLGCFGQKDDLKLNSIIQELEVAMGGRENYNATRYIQWEFAKRKLFWDKWTGNVRVENIKDDVIILVNINTLKGKAFKNGKQIVDKSEEAKLLVKGKNRWINDSYWLVMPWKLQDPGVMLKYYGQEETKNGIPNDVLELTFDGVGITPQNKYLVYIDQKEHLIRKWSFFKNYTDDVPKFSGLWDNYQKAGNILLSFNRSGFGPRNVEVKQNFDDKIFKEL